MIHRGAAVGAALAALIQLSPRACLAATNFYESSWSGGPIIFSADVSGESSDSENVGMLRAAIESAAEAWNQALRIPLFECSPDLQPVTDTQRGNGASEIYFSQVIGPGQSFGLQFGYTDAALNKSRKLVEADLIFNPVHDWRVYRGPLLYDAANNRIPDLHRVVLHELGHVLGLSHPVSDAQETIMRSRMSDIDGLTSRDKADARRVMGA